MVSTLLLSAVVVGIVGAFLIQQTRDGLLENRVDAVVQEAEGETEAARNAAGRHPRPRGRRVGPAAGPRRADHRARLDPRLRGRPVPADRRRHPAGRRWRASSPRASTSSSVPEKLEARFDSVSPTAWTYTDIRTTEEIPGLPEGPGVVVGSQVRLPADDNTYTLYYLYPLDEQQETLALVSRAHARRRRAAAAPRRAA